MVDGDGYLRLAWQNNNEDPPQKVYPFLVNKRGAIEKSFDVSLTGKSTDYRGMAPGEFAEKLVGRSFPKTATVRMKQPNKPGLPGNGWLIRNLYIEPALIDQFNKRDSAAPTFDSVNAELENDIRVASSLNAEELSRIKSSYPRIPERVTVQTTVYRRNPAVVIEVLRRADGCCECCGKPAPFNRRADSTPYLEVHHVVTLADGGEDTTENAFALCPNCHRQRHYG